MMDKSLILEAWARYRPGNNNVEAEEEPESVQNRSIHDVLGGPFMKKMLMGVKQKMYQTRDEVVNGREDAEKQSQKKL